HVGQSDIKGRDIRAMIGPGKILGISAGTVEEAVAAEKAGADYIGVGAVFPTGTKKNATPMTMELLRQIVDAVSIPVVAIGGISAGNITQLAGSGVDGVAVVSAIFAADDPGAATARLLKLSTEMVRAHG
ncbi:MAG: thiamine phosphate synthase, partial [Oscillibacter sp.]|nr:thiamine phosphate synthase [Oscillibacter sp.]